MNRTFSANLFIGCSIALFVYFLKASSLMEFFLASFAHWAAFACIVLVKNRLHYAPSLVAFACDGAAVFLAAEIWTRVRTASRRLLSCLALALLLVPVAALLYHSRQLIITTPLIVFGMLLIMALEALSDLVSSQIHHRMLDQKSEAEFSILGHLSHNVKPNLQIAKSPILAVHDFLERRGVTCEVLAQRLDGSDETVGEALQKALLSLDQIAGILDNTKKLVTQQIRPEEFQEFPLVPLLNREVVPLYGDRLRIEVCGSDQIALRLHKDSFLEGINNLIRNAITHGFADVAGDAELRFQLRETRRKVIIDYTNNGKPFPGNLSDKEFLSYGKKSHDSPGDGLGGAWIGKMIEAHRGSFQIIRDEQPLHFRITLPKGGI